MDEEKETGMGQVIRIGEGRSRDHLGGDGVRDGRGGAEGQARKLLEFSVAGRAC